MHFNNVMPQEKVYLHLDNTGYFTNETMWFKAYMKRMDTDKPSDLSKVLYVELLNPRGDVVQTTKWPVDSLGQAYGEIKLDTVLVSGFYEIRAYTAYMTNWGKYACFSRVVPIFKASKKEGDYTDLSISPVPYRLRVPWKRCSDDGLYDIAIATGMTTSALTRKINMKFYPEGGRLVRGKHCRMAALAVDANGKPYAATGYVTDASGGVLSVIKLDSLGRGVCDFIPETDSLIMQIRNHRGKTLYFPLPHVESEGCALVLDAVSDSTKASLAFSDSLVGGLFAYVVMHNGEVVRCDTMTAAPLAEIELGRKSLPHGVNQLTVFDAHGRIWAERLFFLCPEDDGSDQIKITANTKNFTPCGKVEVDLHAVPNATLSFSAMDYATMNNGVTVNIKTWMLLASEIRGYVHDAEYYFEADDYAHRQASDLLMLTQGWRRYDWSVMEGKVPFEGTHTS